MKIGQGYLYLTITILLSFVGGYAENFDRVIYQGTSFLIATISIVFLLSHLVSIKKLSINKKFLLISVIALSIFSLALGTHKQISLSSLFILTVICVSYLVSSNIITSENLLRVTNFCFLVYLFFSGLLYMGLLPMPEKLNAFEYNLNGIGIRTFIGLFGGTASIDSFAMIVVVLNFFYGKSSQKYYMIVVATFSSIATLRFTPYLIIFLPWMVLALSKWLPPFARPMILVPFFFSFLIPSILISLLDNVSVNLILNTALNGRAFLWVDMLDIYKETDFANKVLGFGGLNGFEVSTWNHKTDNPHSVYFYTLVTYGALLFSIVCILIMARFSRISYDKAFILLAILSAGIGNSVIISFQNFTITLWFIFCLTEAYDRE